MRTNGKVRKSLMMFVVICMMVSCLAPVSIYAEGTSIELVNLADGATFIVNEAAVIKASSDAEIESMEFFVDSESIGTGTEDTDGTYSLTWTPSAVGYYQLTAVASDGTSEYASDAVTVAVREKTVLSSYDFQNVDSSFGSGTPKGTTAGLTSRIDNNAEALNGYQYSFTGYKHTTIKRQNEGTTSGNKNPRWLKAAFTAEQGGDGVDEKSYMQVKFPEDKAYTGIYVQSYDLSIGGDMINGTVTWKVLDTEGIGQSIGKMQGGKIYIGEENADTGVTYTADYDASANTGTFKTITIIYDFTREKAHAYYDTQFLGTCALDAPVGQTFNRFRIEFDNKYNDTYCAGTACIDNFEVGTLAEIQSEVKISNLAEGASVEKGVAMTFSAYVTNAEAQPSSMAFYDGDTLIGNGTQGADGSFNVTWTPAKAGTTQITAEAVVGNKTLISTPVSVNVRTATQLSLYNVQSADSSGNITDTSSGTGSWVYKTSAATGNTVKRDNYTGGSGSSNPRCLTTTYGSAVGTSYLQLAFPTNYVVSTGVYEYSYQISFKGGTTGKSTLYLYEDAETTENLVTLEAGKVQVYPNGSAVETEKGYTASAAIGDKWDDVKVICDYDNKTKDVYFNNELIAHSTFGTEPSTGWVRFRLTMVPSATGEAIAIDNVYVKRLDAPFEVESIGFYDTAGASITDVSDASALDEIRVTFTDTIAESLDASDYVALYEEGLTSVPVAINRVVSGDYISVTLPEGAAFSGSTAYKLAILAGVESANSVATEREFVYSFRTGITDGEGVSDWAFLKDETETTKLSDFGQGDQVHFSAKAQSATMSDVWIIMAHYGEDEMKAVSLSPITPGSTTPTDVSAALTLTEAPASGDVIRVFIWEKGTLNILGGDYVIK